MKCEEIAQLMPDYLGRNLKDAQLKTVERHLEECNECREQVAIWEKLALLPEEQPSPMLRSRFEAMLHAYEQGKWEKSNLESARRSTATGWNFWAWMRAPLAQAAFALIFLAAGFLVGRHISGDNGNTQELAALHKELSSTRQLVALSLLQQQSAGERLQGITWSTRVGQPDPEILGALLHTLRYEVRTGLLDALQTQQSPLVQIALIDLLVDLRDANAVQHLRKFQQTPNLNPAVRQRAEWGLRQLGRG